jgi:hypothetical protein
MDPESGSQFSCPRTLPGAAPGARRALGLGPTDPVPRCWAWACPGCSHLKSWALRRYIKGGMLEAADRGDALVFWTLTEPGSARSWDQSSAALTRLHGAERDRCRRAGATIPRWVAVPELQLRGAVHWHGITALSRDWLPSSYLRSAHALHDRAHAFGFGFVADRQDLAHDRIRLTAWYLAKYCTKDVRMARTVSDRYRRVRSSLGDHRWFSATLTDCYRSWRPVEEYLRKLEGRSEVLPLAS